MTLIDDNLAAEAPDEPDRSEQLIMDDKDLLNTLEKMISEIDDESEISIKEEKE